LGVWRFFKQSHEREASARQQFVQSNVTARIRQLESELQTQLFYRHSRGVTLTSAGKTLLAYTDKIMYLLDETRKAVQHSPVPTGPLSIGSMETTAAVSLPGLLAAYHKQYPDVDITLTTGPTEQLIDSVLHYEIEGVFVAGPVEHPDIVQVPALQEELVLVVQPTQSFDAIFPEIKKRTILVFRSGCSYRAKLEQWLRQEGLTPVKIMEFGSLDAILGCVVAGVGITLLPRSVVTDLERNGSIRCYPIPDHYGQVTTFFIRRRDLFITSAMEKFLEMTIANT